MKLKISIITSAHSVQKSVRYTDKLVCLSRGKLKHNTFYYGSYSTSNNSMQTKILETNPYF